MGPSSIPQPQTPQALPPVLQPQGKKPGQKSSTPSFLGGAMLPDQGQKGQKSLLGQ